jgi:Abnormal spindle-like microcephaly-assoc'd, ASPM-SPD-2-Hydin
MQRVSGLARLDAPRVCVHLVLCLFLLCAAFSGGVAHGQADPISVKAYQLISSRTIANQSDFLVYLDQDSGYNHGYTSGFFANSSANLATIHIDSGCIYDSTTANGCSTNPNILDRTRGTVLRVSFDSQTSSNFAGLNIEEPENWGHLMTGTGYDLRGATSVSFDVSSPDGAMVQFGVGSCSTPYTGPIASTWTTITIPLNSSALNCTPDLSNLHILFAVATNSSFAPHGATVLLDNIQFNPVPTVQKSALGFPLANQTYGVLPQEVAPIPADEILRNLTTIYESGLTGLVLLARGGTQDLVNARLISDTLDYALHHDNHGDPLPVAPDGSVALHNGYENGDVALFNNQQPPNLGQAGDIRLAGFTAPTLCPPSGYCLMLDGATGGNNAFAILELVAAYKQFGDVRYLNDAVTIGNWIVGNLTDGSNTGYGGYFAGYPDMGVPPPKPLQSGKSVENNADIFAAFSALATIESQLGNTGAAATWTAEANVAGDFVMLMFDSKNERFNVGTVPAGTQTGPGVCPTGSQRGKDVINVCDFLDSNTFTTLALAGAPRYRNQIDWRQPVQYALNNFAQTITANGLTYQGFDIVSAPVTGSNGVAWEFTGQVVEAMRFVDKLYAETSFQASADHYLAQIAQAQTSSPFGDGSGLVAATLQDGDTLVPSLQCLDTPYQCIAERVGLAATAWAILTEQQENIFIPFPTPTFSPTGLTFPGQSIGTTSSSQTTILTNTGNVALLMSNVAVSGDFVVAPAGTTCSTGLELAAGSSCTIAVAFTPTALGTRTGMLTINDNAIGSPQTVSLTGTGTPVITLTVSLSPTTLTFASTPQGSTTTAQTVTVKNTGTGTVALTSETITGTNATSFLKSATTCGSSLSAGAICTVSVEFKPAATGSLTASLSVADTASGSPQTATLNGTGAVVSASKLQFVAVTPCRIADTRYATGAFGGPELARISTRTFNIPQSACGIPSTAVAYSLNVTVVPDATLGYLTVWPAGESQPPVSTLNSDGRVKANATITPAGANGGVSVYASDATQFILDIDGYFVPTGTSASGLEFYPVTPCRIADTRNAAGPLGGPFLTGGVGRVFPVQSSSCGIPSTAKAYSLNVTAVPHGSLGFLTAWPTGQAQPVVSTLNATTGAVTANAAIVPAGASGEVSIYVSNDADVILDVNGYFAPPGTGGLSLYTVTPCRVIDTRNGAGAFNGVLDVPVGAGVCAAPAAAKAYVLNATVVPPGGLGYLTLWAAGTAQPSVSTLNASDGAITSNMAIVPTVNGSVDAFSSDSTQLILDLSGYFAP